MSIKDFVLLNELGKGAYSSVFKVQRTIDKQVYALKKVKLLSLSQKQLQNALNQVRILASIHHPNIVAYKETFLENKNLCIIMEYMDSGDLHQLINDKRKKSQYFQENQIWKVLINAIRGLKKLHSMKIFHRDIKSANVFLNNAGQVKLGDMNVSKVAKQGMLYTQTGTPYYACPQIWNEQPYDSKSDIWSLGVVLYEMTALDVPFHGQDMEDLANNIVKGKYPTTPDRYSDELSKFLAVMLELNPSKRPSAQKIARAAFFRKKAKQLGLQVLKQQQSDNCLLSTIKIPKNIQHLTDRFPLPNYEGLQKSKVSQKRSFSQKTIALHKRVKSHQSITKDNSQNKIDKLIALKQKQISEKNHRNILNDKLILYMDKKLQQNHEINLLQKTKQGKRSTLNRKQILQQDLKKIQEGKHQVNRYLY